MPAVTLSEARPMVAGALAALNGRPFALRFFPYPSADARLVLVIIEAPDGADLFEQLVEFDEPIPDIDDELAIGQQFTAAPCLDGRNSNG
jgi:hypothetical protein